MKIRIFVIITLCACLMFIVISLSLSHTDIDITATTATTTIYQPIITTTYPPDVIHLNSPEFSRVMFVSLQREINGERYIPGGYGKMPITEEITMAQARRLTHLTVRDTHSDNVSRGLTGIELLTNLESVSIESEIRPNHFRRLERLPNLHTLRFAGDATPMHDLAYIGRIRNLRTLDLSGNGLSRLNGLQQLTNLTHLNASNNELTDISALRGLTSLERVDLSGNRLSEQELRNNLPEHLITRPGGEEWLQRQIESQNLD